jgi:hypothetical protein
MVLGFGQSKAEDVAALIAKKNYTRAIEVIKSQLQAGKPDDRLRLQLADVLALAGKGREANAILEPLADEYARDGFAAKAISVLKKMQKNDPGRRGIENRLASLIESKQRQATVAAAPASDFPEIGMEEIGFEPPPGGGIAVPVSVPAEPVREPPPPVAAPPPPPPEPIPAPPPAAPLPDIVLVEPSPLTAAPPPVAAPAPPPEREWFLEEPEEAGLEFLEPEGEAEAEAAQAEPIVEAEPEVEAEPMSDSDFASELDSLLDQVFAADAAAAASPEPPRGGSQIVVSPLFQSFSVDEMVAVIQGLRLHTYEPRQFIIREGTAGDSLFMLTSGTVRAFRKNAAGKQALLGELTEGAFFGEGSILTGQPRAASVVAWTPCELLELDRATLDSIVSTHPHVRDVLKDFAAKRARRG